MTGHFMRLVAGAAAMAVVGTGGLAAQDTFQWGGQVPSGGALKIKGISGNVRAEAAPGGTVEVTAQKRGWSGDFGEVEIRMEQDGRDVVVCAVYRPAPGSEGCESQTFRGEGRGGRDRSINVSVDFVVRLSAGTPLHASMVSGDIVARDLRSDVRASTVSGDVTVSTSGVAEASTVSGDLDILLGSTGWDDLEYSTVSGDITIRLPAGAGTDIRASSLSGDFESDFDVVLRGRTGRRWVGSEVRGTIGEGGPSLALKTVSGDVRVLRAR
jgi:DUF4097 and DUF4098 domain-containing protein YvlB